MTIVTITVHYGCFTNVTSILVLGTCFVVHCRICSKMDIENVLGFYIAKIISKTLGIMEWFNSIPSIHVYVGKPFPRLSTMKFGAEFEPYLKHREYTNNEK